MAKCMLIQASLPPKFEPEAVLTSAYIRNRCPSTSLKGNYVAWTGRKPTASYLQPFGKVAHVLDKNGKRGKFDLKTSRCIFIGYSPTFKAYRMWDPKSRKVLKSRDVSFLNEYSTSEDTEKIINDDILLQMCAKESINADIQIQELEFCHFRRRELNR